MTSSRETNPTQKSAPVSLIIPDPHGGAEHIVFVNDARSEQFAARLRKVAKERRKWARANGITCYRIYDADLPDYCAAIDWYEPAQTSANEHATPDSTPRVHIAEYRAPSHIDEALAAQRFQDIVTITPVVLGIPPEYVFTKVRQRQHGAKQYTKLSAAAQPNKHAAKAPHPLSTFIICEGDALLEVDLGSYLDTGLFLDHRTTRLFLAQSITKRREAQLGTRFLNLFSYTASATVHAAKAGATHTTTVDLSQTYLAWGERNLALNGITMAHHEFIRANCVQWLSEAAEQGKTWDVIFCDPPTFSNSKAMGNNTWEVQRDHIALLEALRNIAAPGALVIFSNNLRNFNPDTATLDQRGIHLRDVSQKSIPHDFERNAKIHHCYIVTFTPQK